MQEKRCPRCKVVKPIEDFHKYFSKSRQQYRIGNYCKPCANADSLKRAKEYYQQNKAKVLHYQNVERKEWRMKKNAVDREKLADPYVLLKLRQSQPSLKTEDFRNCPMLIEAKRTQILTSRIKKALKNGKK